MRKYILWAGAGIAAIFLFYVGFRLINPASAEHLSQKDVKQMVEGMYAGTVSEIVDKGEEFQVELEKDQGKYQLIVDRESGEILSLVRTEIKASEEKETEKGEEKEKQVAEKSEEKDDQGTEQKNTEEKVVKKEEKKVEKQESKSEQKTSSPKKESSPPKKQLTEQQAANIALKQVSGEIDDIELETINGVPYYFVEVEANDDEEALVQINAVSGEVKSLTWDD